jgi:hypothetical protein
MTSCWEGMMGNGNGNVTVDGRGFVWVDGVKVCRYVAERGTLAFIDRDRRRCSERGGREVEVGIEEIRDATRDNIHMDARAAQDTQDKTQMTKGK